MVDLPSIPDVVPQVRAPQSRVSPGEIAQPYQELASSLDKTAGALDVAAEGLAKQAGYRAVTRDAAGNVQVDSAPIVGDAAIAYHRAVKFAALADGEGVAKRDDIALRQQHRDDPQGYEAAAETYKQEKVQQYTDAAGADVGLTLGRVIDQQTTQTYKGLLNEHERLTLQRTDRSIETGITSARDDLTAMARGGVTSGPAWDAAAAKVRTLTEERVANPRLAYPREQADYDLQHLQGDLSANAFLHHIDEVYKDPDKGGAQPALETAKSILTDPSIKLTEQQRDAYYHRAVGEIHANESIRRQDLHENHTAASELRAASSLGLPIAPEMVDRVAQQFYKLNDPGSAARLYAWAARAPLHDDFGRQPLQDQTRQLMQVQGAAVPEPLVSAVKGFEGFEPTAKFDYKQYSVGYGTRGVPGETIDRATADFRLRSELGRAAAIVDQVNPNLPPGVKAALTSLTFNAGADWVNAGLGEKIRAGDFAGAKQNFLEYNKAGGVTNPALASRRSVEAQWFDAGGPASKVAPTDGPAGSLWLQVNRSSQVQSEARKDWQIVAKDWDEKGVVPNSEATMAIVNAARATGDHALLDQIGSDMARVQAVQTLAEGPLAGQEAQLAELRRMGAAGELAPGQAMVLKQLQARHIAITEGLDKNPIATTTANFNGKFSVPAPLPSPLDPAKEGDFVAGLAYRAKVAAFAQQNWGGPARAAMDQGDIANLKAAIESGSPADKARILGDITQAIPDERVRSATLGKLGETGGPAMVAAYAGGLMREAPDVAQGILRGQSAVKADPRYEPGKSDKQAYDEHLDRILPPTAFSLAARTDDRGAYAAITGAVKARYADLAAQAGDTSAQFKADRLETAVIDVTGGLVDHNGARIFAPTRGMPQGQFDRVLAGITDRDLSGITTMMGEPVTADYLRNSARLESVGDGQYGIRLGRNDARPIYAYTKPEMGPPRKAVIDLRNRLAGSIPIGMLPASAAMP